MKRIYFITILLAFAAAITQCVKESDNSERQLTYFTTTEGGCNNENDLKNAYTESQDTVFATVTDNSALKLSVGINYLCCTPFTSNVSINNNLITIEITDTCQNNCYCKCMCYYTWDFLFDNYSAKVYHYKIILHDPQQDDPVIFREGEVEITK